MRPGLLILDAKWIVDKIGAKSPGQKRWVKGPGGFVPPRQDVQEIRDAESRRIYNRTNEKITCLVFWRFFVLDPQTEITPIAPVGIRGAVDDLIPSSEKKTGYKVQPTYGTGLVTKKQVADGEPFDAPIVQVPYEEVVKSGTSRFPR